MNTKKIRQQYLQILPKLREALSIVQDKLSDLPQPDFELNINFKPYKSIKEKYVKDKLSNLSEMSDLVRGRLFFSSDYQIEEVLSLLKKLFRNTVHNIDKKRGKAEYELEYTGVTHLDLNINDINFELQVMPIEFKPFKLLLHNIYEKLRSQDNNLSEEKKEALRNLNNKIYKKLNLKATQNRSNSK